MKNHFNNIAKLVVEFRNKKGLSQIKVANKLGQVNGQFVSNIERALCSVPYGMAYNVCDILDIPHSKMREAMLADYGERFDASIDVSMRVKFPESIDCESGF